MYIYFSYKQLKKYMKLPLKHFSDTKRLLKSIPSEKGAKWLLEEGYFPEQYIVPQTFKVLKFD